MVVSEDPQARQLVGEDYCVGVPVVGANANEHEKPGVDRRDRLPIDGDGRPGYSLDQRSHAPGA
jgi:hypothetical protein